MWGLVVLLVVGADDNERSFLEPAEQLRQSLSRRSPERRALVQIPGLGHALAGDPGLKAAPQTAQAAEVDAVLVAGFAAN